MSDIYIPGVKSRFNSEKIIEDLMTIERIPKERTERNVEYLQVQKGYWQEVGRRIHSVRESARQLYSFQNPFSDRIARSADESVIGASATREAGEQTYRFTVKQTAQADRFLSAPLDEKMKVEGGTYAFSVGNEEVSINFRGGSLKEFVDVLNRRGQDKISASLMSVQSGTKSLLIESKISGFKNRLGFSGDATEMMIRTGMMERSNDTRRDISITENTVRKTGALPGNFSVKDGILQMPARSSASLPVGLSLAADSPVILKFETLTKVETDGVFEIPQPPPGPAIPSSGSVTYGDITIENEPSFAPLPEWKPPAVPQRHDDLAVLGLIFSDGSSAKLPPISDSGAFVTRQFQLSDIAQGRTIVALNVENANTHREISIGNIEIFDPTAVSGGLKPLNAISTARDAIITLEGIEMSRSSNSISDIVPGLTLNVRGISDRPVELRVSADIEGIKDAVISFVGNYNRLMAELNVLTAPVKSSQIGQTPTADSRIIDELTYLSADEAAEMKKRLGVFSGDTTLNSFKSSLQRTVSAPYPTSLERDLALLYQIGISTNAEDRGGGYNVSRMRGYLQIDPKILDAALENKVMAVKELFASDTTGDMIMDTGIAVTVEAMSKPFVETGGIISLKTNTLDSRIKQDERRIDTMERQLAAKEAELKMQYGRMEGAFARMEQMSNALDNFNQQNRNNNNR